jgi:hypothetical protein
MNEIYAIETINDKGIVVGVSHETEDRVSDVRNDIRAAFPVGSSWTVKVTKLG